MKSLQELKKEIVFNNEMYELIDILKKTAVAQFQVLSTKHKTLTVEKRFSGYLDKIFDLINYRVVRHPVLTNPTKRVLLVIMTTDLGFLGGVNTNMIETALSRVGRRDEVLLVVVGEKGRDYFEGAGRDCAFLPGVSDEVKFEEAVRL
ncbi:MAG: F0F1 ATP synthase subunit gamma, partial [Planctomycetota bacterium]